MKDCFDTVNDVISLINSDEITVDLKAKIWPHFMPNGLVGVNIVVKALNCTNQAIQQSTVIINIHVSNIISGGRAVADQSAFSNISAALLLLLDAQYKYSFWTEVIRTSKIYREPDGSHFSAITVKYRSIQTNYKNI